MTYRKKLIEVALPLEAINVASAKEKSNPFVKGHPRSLHQWWSRKPLATARAVLFASLVDDPSSRPDLFATEEAQDRERQRLFRLIEQLVLWENSNNERVLSEAREEIMKSTDGNPPPVLDPFAGGGSIPLEAQRLGLEAHASDLNPVAVLINKAQIEIPPKFAGNPPVNPEARQRFGTEWRGAHGLAEDVRYYSRWMREEAQKRIGHLFPKVQLPSGYGEDEAKVIAWIYCRSVKCPNPACGAEMPLVSKWWLSTKPGKKAWIEPVVDRTQHPPHVSFDVRTGTGEPPEPPKVGRGAQFKCLACGTISPDQHIKDEGMGGRMGTQLMAIVAEGRKGRVFVRPTPEHEAMSKIAHATGPTQQLANDPRNIWCVSYGLDTFNKLFTPRQLVALTTFSDLVGEARECVEQDARAAGLANNGLGIGSGGTGAREYADAIAIYLAFVLDKATDYNNSFCTWNPTNSNVGHLFTKQAIPMAWDFTEASLLEGGLAFDQIALSITEALKQLPSAKAGTAEQLDAMSVTTRGLQPLISTDPPYYDNIAYADLSDFFYVWLRRCLEKVYPALFSTVLVPKAQELVATPYRFSGKVSDAKSFFEKGFNAAFSQLCGIAHSEYPVTVYNAPVNSDQSLR